MCVSGCSCLEAPAGRSGGSYACGREKKASKRQRCTSSLPSQITGSASLCGCHGKLASDPSRRRRRHPRNWYLDRRRCHGATAMTPARTSPADPCSRFPDGRCLSARGGHRQRHRVRVLMYTKMGYAGNVEPCFIIPTVVAVNESFSNQSRSSAKGNWLAQHNAIYSALLQVGNWDAMERFWQQCIFNYLRCDPEDHYFLLTESPLTAPENREYTGEIMFETFNVPGLYIAVQPVLALAAGYTTSKVISNLHVIPDSQELVYRLMIFQCTPRFAISTFTARYGWYIPVRQVAGMRTARYRAVPSKIDRRRSISIVGGRLKGEIDCRRSIEGEISRWRSIEREKGKKKKKRKKKKRKEKRRRKNTYRPRAVLAARGLRALFLPCGEKDQGDSTI
ncbi:hypothetical protein BHE74_00033463, partial [Ensete ventricosum]